MPDEIIPVATPQGQPADSTPAPAGAPDNKGPGGEHPEKPEEGAAKKGEGEGEKAPESESSPQPKGVQKRLDEMRRQIGDVQRMNDRLLAIVEKSLKGDKAPPLPEVPAGPPKRENFDTYEEYLDAKADWKVAETLNEVRRRALHEQAQQVAVQREREWEARQAKAASKYEDFLDVVNSEDLPITDVMADAIKETEAGPEIAYFLGKNPREAARIAALSPAAQVREIGKIEARLELTPAKAPSKAPAPVDPVRGETADVIDLSTAKSQKEYEAMRAKQIKASGGR